MRGPCADRRPEHVGFVLAFALLCVGFLVHFSVGPYAFFLGLHYLFVVWRKRPRKWAEAAVIVGVSLAVLATWFVWSVAYYGSKTTFTSTSAVSDAVVMTPTQNVANISRNLGNTLLPTIVRSPSLLWSEDLEQPAVVGQVRDFCFLIYQVSVPGGLGVVGFPLVVWLLWRTFRGRLPGDAARRRFWMAFVPIVYVLGVVAYGGTDRFGVAHVCLQPLTLLGLCLLAGGVWTLSPRVRGWLLVGLLLDFGFGVMLQMTLQHHVFHIDPIFDAQGHIAGYDVPPAADVPSRSAQRNFGTKIEGNLTYWGDHFAGGLLAMQFIMGCLLAFLLFKGLVAPRWRKAELRATARMPDARTTRRPTPRGRKR